MIDVLLAHRLKSSRFYRWSNVQYDSNWVMPYSILANMAWPSDICCNWPISLKRSQSECL